MSERPNVTAYIYDKRGRLLSTGRNSYVKTHPLQARAARTVNQPSRIFLHAEIAAVAKLSEADARRARKIVVVRLSAKGEALNAKPCPICRYVIETLTNIKEVEHT